MRLPLAPSLLIPFSRAGHGGGQLAAFKKLSQVLHPLVQHDGVPGLGRAPEALLDDLSELLFQVEYPIQPDLELFCFLESRPACVERSDVPGYRAVEHSLCERVVVRKKRYVGDEEVRLSAVDYAHRGHVGRLLEDEERDLDEGFFTQRFQFDGPFVWIPLERRLERGHVASVHADSDPPCEEGGPSSLDVLDDAVGFHARLVRLGSDFFHVTQYTRFIQLCSFQQINTHGI